MVSGGTRTARVVAFAGELLALVLEAQGRATDALAQRALDARERADWEVLVDVLAGVRSDLAGYVEAVPLLASWDETSLGGARPEKQAGGRLGRGSDYVKPAPALAGVAGSENPHDAGDSAQGNRFGRRALGNLTTAGNDES